MSVPLTFIHGFTGQPSAWQATIDALPASPGGPAPRALVVPGHDPSAPLRDDDDFEGVAARMAAEVDPGATLVGYSLGARLALSMVAQAPARFARLVAVGLNPGLTDRAAAADREAADARLAAMLRTDGIEAFVEHWASLPLFDTQACLPAALLRAQREARLQHDPEQLARVLEVLGLAQMPAYGDLLGASPIEVTLVTGALDRKFSAIAAALAVARNVTHVSIDGAGHNLPLEAPRPLAAVIARR